jgi:hypothetical protein
MPYTKIRLTCTNFFVLSEVKKQLKAYLDDRDETCVPKVEGNYRHALLDLEEDEEAYDIFVRVHRDQEMPGACDASVDAINGDDIDFENEFDGDDEFDAMMKALNPPEPPLTQVRPRDSENDDCALPPAKRLRLVEKLQAVIPFARPEVLLQAVDEAFPLKKAE